MTNKNETMKRLQMEVLSLEIAIGHNEEAVDKETRKLNRKNVKLKALKDQVLKAEKDYEQEEKDRELFRRLSDSIANDPTDWSAIVPSAAATMA